MIWQQHNIALRFWNAVNLSVIFDITAGFIIQERLARLNSDRTSNIEWNKG